MNVLPLHPCAHLPTALRNIADQLDDGEYGEIDEATLIFPGASDIFHLGTPPNDDNAGISAMFNMQCGITKMALAVLQETDHE